MDESKNGNTIELKLSDICAILNICFGYWFGINKGVTRDYIYLVVHGVEFKIWIQD